MCNPAEVNFMLDHCSPNYKRGKMNTSTYVRRPFEVEAVQVTAENIQQVAEWCGGEVKNKGASGDRYIKVPVQSPVNVRQGEAHLGDWVLFANRGFKCYTDKAFERAFVSAPKPDVNTVLDNSEFQENVNVSLA